MRTREQQRELARTSDRLHKHEAEEMLAILAAHFDVPVPRLKWRMDSQRGWANWLKWEILCGTRSWIGTTNTLIHEFAHLLNHHRNNRHKVRPHGREFIQCLIEVAAAWHGDVTRYGWGLEYATVRAAAPKPDKEAK